MTTPDRDSRDDFPDLRADDLEEAPGTGAEAPGLDDPATTPAGSVPLTSATPSSPDDRAPRRTRASAAWASVVVALLLLIIIIVFVLQNPTPVVIHFLGWSGTLDVGMAMLIAAVTGGLLVATVGVARLTQLRIRARRSRAPAP